MGQKARKSSNRLPWPLPQFGEQKPRRRRSQPEHRLNRSRIGPDTNANRRPAAGQNITVMLRQRDSGRQTTGSDLVGAPRETSLDFSD